MSISIKLTTGSKTAGDIFSLECTLNGLSFIKNISFQWLLPINTSTHIYENSSVSQLEFNPLQQLHEGIVTCQATVDNIERKANYTITVNGK